MGRVLRALCSDMAACLSNRSRMKPRGKYPVIGRLDALFNVAGTAAWVSRYQDETG